MISSRAKYAIRALLRLAQPRPQPWMTTADIASDEKIPAKFLEAILLELREGGLLESRRGPGGGHRLRMRPERITVADVLRMVDGPLALTPCASRTAFAACTDCVGLAECRIRSVLQLARDAVANVLEQRTLADLLSETEEPAPEAPRDAA